MKMVTRNEQLLAEAVRSRYLYVFLSDHQFVSIFIKKKKKVSHYFRWNQIVSQKKNYINNEHV